MSIPGLMIHSVKIQERTTTRGGLGGPSVAWSDKSTGIECRIQPRVSRIVDEHGQVTVDVTHRVYFSADPSIATGDRLVGESPTNILNKTWDAVTPAENTDFLDRLWWCDCVEAEKA